MKNVDDMFAPVEAESQQKNERRKQPRAGFARARLELRDLAGSKVALLPNSSSRLPVSATVRTTQLSLRPRHLALVAFFPSLALPRFENFSRVGLEVRTLSLPSYIPRLL